jgi:hypothetical protein
MADWPTIASSATAGGTLVLAVATFSSVRAGRRSARIAERSTGIAERALLMPRFASEARRARATVNVLDVDGGVPAAYSR